MPNITLNAIREHGPCAEGWRKLLSHLGKTGADDEPLDLLTILDSNGIDDALWCLQAMPEHDKHWRLYAVWCARQVQHLMTDARSIAVLDVAERYANGEATDVELAAARAAACDAACDAWDSACDARAASAAWDATRAAYAACDARAARAARAACDAASAAWDSACVTAWASQAARLRAVCAQIDAMQTEAA